MTDPRFDPAFQRGYSGPDPELVVRPASPAGEVQPASSATDAAPPPVVPVAVGRSAAPSAAALPPGAAAESNPGHIIHNRYRLALLLAGIVLLLAATTTLYSQLQQLQTSNRTAEAQFEQLLIYNLPPALILAGFACIILWLALGALDRIEPQPEPQPVHTSDRETG